MGANGREWPSEAKRITDEQTGATVWQMTDHASINHSLYFLTNSFLPDERSLIFASFRDGVANFYRAGFPNGPIVQLTDVTDINSFSAVLSHDGNALFFTRGDSIMSVDLESLEAHELAQFPGGKLGEVNLSPDGQWIVSAVHLGKSHGIALASTGRGGSAIIYHQERTIIHPQFHPFDSTLIEYASDPAPRMHLIRRDGNENRCLHEHGNDEFVVHETWLGDTGDLVFTVWPHSLKRMHIASGQVRTIADFNAWHICPSLDGEQILCDTNHPDTGMQLIDVATGRRRTICYPASSNGGSQWLKSCYALKADFEAAASGSAAEDNRASWMEMKTDTVYGPQWTHPHPSFGHSGQYATFTSDRTGHPQVYVVQLPASLPEA